MSWWTRLKPSVKPDQGVLAAVLLSSVMAGGGVLWIWQGAGAAEEQMTRFGQGLSQTLAHTSAGELLHGNRIELTVIATDVVRLPEVAGVVFYNAKNEILAVNGSSDRGAHFTSPATLDDTITGYVSVILQADAFTPAVPWWRWVGTGLAVLAAPLLGWLVLLGANRGSQSLPIVSVPEPEPQRCYCVAITLHNQMALGRADMEQAIADANTMAMEAGAAHDGLCLTVKPRGVLMLFDASTGADEALRCARLVLSLLAEFETRGDFRAALGQTQILGSLSEQTALSPDELDQGDLDTLFTLAALSKREVLLVSHGVYQQLQTAQQQLAADFTHPLAQDLVTQAVYEVRELTGPAQQWVDEQAGLILGFTQPSLHHSA